MLIRQLLFALIYLLISLNSQVQGATKIIIAENGGGKALVGSTLSATTLAATMDIDYLELQVVMTSDNELLVFQDLSLNRLTDVQSIFPDRKREDGNYYVIDFTLGEIRQLRLKDNLRTDPFPLSLGIPTLEEELSLIRRLETILKKEIGIAVEIKQPWFHRDAGKDISNATLDILSRFNYNSLESKIYLQCFDPEELQRIHNHIFAEKKMRLPLIQLIGQNDGMETKQLNLGKWEPYIFDWMFTNTGLRIVAGYATAIGLPSMSIVDRSGTLLLGGFIKDVHKYELKVLTFSLNNQEEEIPAFAVDFSSLLNFFYTKAGIDGLYTDSFQDVFQYNTQPGAEKRKSDLPAFFDDLEFSKPVQEGNNIDAQQ